VFDSIQHLPGIASWGVDLGFSGHFLLSSRRCASYRCGFSLLAVAWKNDNHDALVTGFREGKVIRSVKTGVCVRTHYVLRIQKRRRQLILSVFPPLPSSSSHEHIAVYQMCYRWRWGCREDLHANILYQQHVSHGKSRPWNLIIMFLYLAASFLDTTTTMGVSFSCFGNVPSLLVFQLQVWEVSLSQGGI
jgi:hypothetical protein